MSPSPDSHEARSFTRPNTTIQACHTTQKRNLLKPALGCTLVRSTVVLCLHTTSPRKVSLQKVLLLLHNTLT